MLDLEIKPHRQYVNAHQADQKLFVALSLRPQAAAARSRAPIAAAFVVDTSGSMREIVAGESRPTGRQVRLDGQLYNEVTGGISKAAIVIQSLRELLGSQALQPQDRIGVVRFDDQARVLAPLTPSSNSGTLQNAFAGLEDATGGTMMGLGMAEGFRLLREASGNRRLILFTDGLTGDEERVRETSEQLRQAGISVTAVGVGDEWNEELLSHITDATQGRPFHVIADENGNRPPSVQASQLPHLIFEEFRHAGLEVVSRVELTVSAVKGVKLERISRVYPTLSEVTLSRPPVALGNIEANDWTTFILEFTLPARPDSRARIAQLSLTYEVPGQNYRGEIPPQNLVIEYTSEAAKAGQIDSMVMNYVQQRNLEAMVAQAVVLAKTDPAAAQKTIALAKSMTQKLGNSAMTKALDQAAGELATGHTISASTSKTLRIGSKTQTVRMQEDQGPTLSEEELRKLTGI